MFLKLFNIGMYFIVFYFHITVTDVGINLAGFWIGYISLIILVILSLKLFTGIFGFMF